MKGIDQMVIDDKRALLFIAAYFFAHFIIRILAPTSLELDESAELVRTQFLSLGYGTQPPLYTWVLILLFSLFGANVWVLAVFKSLLLFGTYGFVYASSKKLGFAPSIALLTSGSMLLFPQIGWESQRDLTHTVLATFAASGFFYLFISIVKSPRTLHYLLLGLFAGIGLLAKYNFALFLAAIFFTALLIPKGRERVFDLRILWSFAVSAILLIPHVFWLVGNVSLASDGTLAKLGVIDALDIVHSSSAFFGGLLNFALIYIFASLFLVSLARSSNKATSEWSLVWIYLIVALTLLFLISISLGISTFKDRWFQPVLFLLPLVFFSSIDFDGIAKWRTRVYVGIVSLLGLAYLAGMTVQVHFSEILNKPTRFAVPYQKLINNIGISENSLVIASDTHIGGAIKLLRPKSLVWVVGELHNDKPKNKTQECLIVWSSGKNNEEKISLWLDEYVGIEKSQRFIGLSKRLSVHGENLNQRYNFSYVQVDCENIYQNKELKSL